MGGSRACRLVVCQKPLPAFASDYLQRPEIPRLCRGGSRSLTDPGVHFLSAMRQPVRGYPVLRRPEWAPILFCYVWELGIFDFNRLRSGPFEGPKT